MAQKQQYHYNHQRGGDQQRLLGLVQGGGNHRRAIHRHLQLCRGWQYRLQTGHFLFDIGNGGNDVGIGLAVDHQQHRALIIEKTAVVAVFHIIGNPRHIAQTQDRTIALTDNQRCIVGSFVELVVGLNLPVPAALLHLPLGALLVGAGNGLAHLIQRHAVMLQQARLQLNPHRRQRGTANLHITDTLHLQQFLPDNRLGQIIQLATAEAVTGQRQHHDRRLGRVDLAVGGHTAHTAGQQLAGGVNRSLHFAGGGIDVAIQVKLDHHPCRALKAAAGHLGNAGNAAKSALQWSGHRRRHYLRAGTGQAGLYGNYRKVHVRQRCHRQQAKAQNPRQHNGDAQ